MGRLYAPVRCKDIGCGVPIELGKLGTVPECGGADGGNGGKHHRFLEKES